MEDVNVTAPTSFERNGAKSTISALATDNRVILKLTYEVSPMSIRSHYDNPKSKLGDVANVNYEIASIGENVKNLQLGDKVLVSTQPDVFVDIVENNNTLLKLGEQLSKLSKLEYDNLIHSGVKWIVTEYGIFSSFQVVAILLK